MRRAHKILDWLGTGASLACAIHCSILPILLAYSAFQGLSWLGGHTAELVFIVLATVIAIPAFAIGYTRHRHWLPLTLACIGFCMIFFTLFNHQHIPGMPLWIPTIAGLMIAFAHLLNLRYSKQLRRSMTAMPLASSR